MRDYKPARKKKSRSTSKNRSSFQSKKTSFIAICLIIISIFVLMSLSLSYLFPLKSAQTIFLSSDLGQGNSATYILRLVPSENSATLIELDSEKRVEVLGGYGEYKLNALYPLLKIEKKSDSVIRSALSLSLETIIDEMAIIPKNSPIESKKNLQEVLFGVMYSDRSQVFQFPKYLSYYLFVRGASFEKHEISESGYSSRTKQVLQAETPETCPIAILNTTETRGLAGRIGRVYENSGMNVIRVNSDSSEVEKTRIYFDDSLADCVDLVSKVAQAISDPLVESNIELAERYRAGIVVLVGDDFTY